MKRVLNRNAEIQYICLQINTQEMPEPFLSIYEYLYTKSITKLPGSTMQFQSRNIIYIYIYIYIYKHITINDREKLVSTRKINYFIV